MCYSDVIRPGSRPVVTDIPNNYLLTVRPNTQIFFSDNCTESAETISDGIIEASKITASAINKNAYTISRSILAASNNILSSLNSISDNIEKNTKMQEFYTLLKEIEKFEDYCIEHKILKEVYQNLDIEEQKPLKQDINLRIAKGMICFVGNDITTIEDMAINLSLTPLTTLAHLLLNSGKKDIYSRISILETGMFVYDSSYLIAPVLGSNNLARMKNAIYNTIDLNLELYELEIKSSQHKFISEHSKKLMSIVPTINQNIEFNNLRKLHLSLRNAVREDKIKRAMF